MIDFSTSIYKQRTDIAVVALDVGGALFLSADIPQELQSRLYLCIVGTPLFGEKFVKAYASLDLLGPGIRSEYEDEWFSRELLTRLPAGVDVSYVD